MIREGFKGGLLPRGRSPLLIRVSGGLAQVKQSCAFNFMHNKQFSRKDSERSCVDGQTVYANKLLARYY